MAQVKGVTDLGMFPGARPAQPQHQGGSRKGRALRPQCRRHQHGGAGGPGRRRRDDAAGRRPPIQRRPSGWRRNIATDRGGRATSRSAIRRRAAPMPTFRLSELADISLDTGASYIYPRAQSSATSRSSSACAAATSAAPSPRRRSALPQNVRCRTATASTGPANSRSCSRPRSGSQIVVPISLVLILVLLYGLFNSLRDSLLALAGIPFADRRRRARALSSPAWISASRRRSASCRCSASR